MIKFSESGLLDCFPQKDTPEIIALSYALQNAIKVVIQHSDESRVYCAIEQLPERVLDVLAVEMRSLYYDESLSVEQKREIIKNTMQWYAKAGTPAAVEDLIQTIFGVGDVVEWFDYDEAPYTRGTFDIITSALMEKDMIEKFTRIVQKAKNARSHIRRIMVEREVNVRCKIVALCPCWQESVVSNHIIGDREGGKRENIIALGALETESAIVNDLQREAEAQKVIRAAAEMEEIQESVILNDYQKETGTTGRQRAAAAISAPSVEVTAINDSGERTAAIKGVTLEAGGAEVSSTTQSYVYRQEETELREKPKIIGTQEVSQETVIK